MSKPRRPIGEIPLVFISNSTYQHKPLFNNIRNAALLMGIIKEYERRNYFHIETFCVMPDHYHILLRILSNKSLSQIIYSINSYFAYRHRKQFGIVRIWSRNTWDVWIRSEEMYWQKVAYVLLNPWRAGLVGIPYSDYPYSDISEWRMTYGIRFLNDIFEQYSRGME